ncbi:MAG: hypothetical protein F7C35_06570 [Desulfurococcales archaeon]|nr:hypothetical protein [Desulfurococcales archaeon]
MFSRRNPLDQLGLYAMRIDIYERDSVSEHVYSGILEYVMNVKANNIDDIIAGVRQVCSRADYLGKVCILCNILEKLGEAADDYGLDVAYFKRALKSIIQRLEVTLQNAENQYLGMLDQSLTPDSQVLLLSFNSRTERLISSLRYKIRRIMIPVREPMKTGIAMASNLKRKGLPVHYIPDEALGWAVAVSDAVLIDAIGSMPGGRVIVDAGGEPALAIAASRGVKGVVLLSVEASCERRGESEKTPSFIIESKLGGPPVRISLIDIIDPKITPFLMVTENDIVKASRRVVRERQRVVRELIDDIVQFTLESML